MPLKLIPNPRFEHQLTTDESRMQRMLADLSYLADEARSRTRRRKNFLAKSITLDVGFAEEHGQIIARLNAGDFKAVWYEFGSARTPKDAMLRSTVEDNIGPVTGGDK